MESSNVHRPSAPATLVDTFSQTGANKSPLACTTYSTFGLPENETVTVPSPLFLMPVVTGVVTGLIGSTVSTPVVVADAIVAQPAAHGRTRNNVVAANERAGRTPVRAGQRHARHCVSVHQLPCPRAERPLARPVGPGLAAGLGVRIGRDVQRLGRDLAGSRVSPPVIGVGDEGDDRVTARVGRGAGAAVVGNAHGEVGRGRGHGDGLGGGVVNLAQVAQRDGGRRRSDDQCVGGAAVVVEVGNRADDGVICLLYTSDAADE